MTIVELDVIPNHIFNYKGENKKWETSYFSFHLIDALYVPYYINQRISIKSTISIYEKLSLGSPLRTVRPIPHHNACISLMPINGKDVWKLAIEKDL